MSRQLAIFLILLASLFCSILSDSLPSSELPQLHSTNITAGNVACTVDITTQTGSPQPIFIRPGTSNFFHPANRQGQLQLSAGQEIELFCSGTFLSPAGAENSIRAACVSGQRFRFQNVDITFNQFSCRTWPTWTTRRTSNRCFGNGILVDVGFQVGTRWLNVYTVCHDLSLETNWYVKYRFSPVADANQRNVVRPNWTQDGFYTNTNVNSLYTRAQQRRTIADILQDQESADRFVEPDPSDLFLARGHLAAMTDFMLATEQHATFHFLNAAPQWQTFNAQNWVSVEISSRRLAGDRGLNLDVYTGTFGVSRLWNRSGSRREIFLDWPARRIPKPMIYYKILVNNADMTGVVLIGVNNPHLTLNDIQQHGYIICPDVSSRINYVSWQRTNLLRGFGYACEIQEFLRVVPHIPELTTNRYQLLV